MSHDLQLVRGHDGEGYNLAIGEPFFMHEDDTVEVKGPFLYPSPVGEHLLLEELKTKYPQYKYIVITNGGKQAISAAFYALKQLEDKKVVVHRAPYWPSYPTLAKMAGLDFSAFGYGFPWEITCSTEPNNPDGSCPLQDCDIWDAVYASPAYGWNGVEPKHRIRIDSASKRLGLSGLRVGWLLTNDEKIAQKAAEYIEFTTSGVSVASQMTVCKFSHCKLEHGHRAPLTINALSFDFYIRDFCSDVTGLPESGMGMFAWFKIKEKYQEKFAEALQSIQVKLVTGVACGVTEYGWYRMNLGHKVEYTEEALRRVSEYVRRLVSL